MITVAARSTAEATSRGSSVRVMVGAQRAGEWWAGEWWLGERRQVPAHRTRPAATPVLVGSTAGRPAAAITSLIRGHRAVTRRSPGGYLERSPGSHRTAVTSGHPAVGGHPERSPIRGGVSTGFSAR